LGVGEFAGPADNPRIAAYHRACGDDVTDDEVPWCSSFVNWCMQIACIPRTESRAARSWINWGVELREPIYGCVCVLWRDHHASWKGHVGFYLDSVGDEIVMLGGNQGDEVSVRRYPKGRVLGYRWM
jgi:uncharacterized protein (TIGR02594 family)